MNISMNIESTPHANNEDTDSQSNSQSANSQSANSQSANSQSSSINENQPTNELTTASISRRSFLSLGAGALGLMSSGAVRAQASELAEPTHMLRLEQEGIRSIRFMPDSSGIIVSGQNGAQTWKFGDSSLSGLYKSVFSDIEAFAASDAGTAYVVINDRFDTELQRLDDRGLYVEFVRVAQSSVVTDLVISPDQQQIAVLTRAIDFSLPHQVSIFGMESFVERSEFQFTGAPPLDMSFAPNSESFVVSTGRFYPFGPTGQPAVLVFSSQGEGSEPVRIEEAVYTAFGGYGADGASLVTAKSDFLPGFSDAETPAWEVNIRSADSFEVQRSVQGEVENAFIEAMNVSPVSNHAAIAVNRTSEVGAEDPEAMRMVLIDTQAGTEVARAPFTGVGVSEVTFSPNGQLVAVSSYEGTREEPTAVHLRVWDVQDLTGTSVRGWNLW